MRILFVSNFYPPARPGGYTQWCQEVAQGLEARGHRIAVLTSRHEAERAPANESDVYRLLNLESDPLHYSIVDFFSSFQRNSEENDRSIRLVLHEFSPDIVFIWGMWLMSKSIPATFEALMGSRVVYYLSDYWPTRPDPHRRFWDQRANRWYTRPIRQVLARVANQILDGKKETELRFENAICVSRAVKTLLIERGIPVRDAEVIHGGSDLNRFLELHQYRSQNGPSSLLYAGQLVPHKGVHTAIEALSHLVSAYEFGGISLTLAGSGPTDYEAMLRDMIASHGLQEHVTFRGQVQKSEMPALYAQHDILVFPSTYQEPFARVTQEAMASGMVVVGTTTGGTGELLVEGLTGLTFAPSDSHGLARQIARLIRDPGLKMDLSRVGRKTVASKFTLEQMVDEVERYLEARQST